MTASAISRALDGRSSGLLGQAAHDDVLERRRNRQLGARGRPLRYCLHVLQRHRHGIGVVEHERAGQQEVGDASDGVEVGAVVDHGLAEGDFRCDVSGRAARHPFHGELSHLFVLAQGLGQAEVQDLHEVVGQRHFAEHHVRRFQVAMHQGVLMRLLEREAHLPDDVGHAVGWLRSELRDERLQADAVEQLHHVVEPAILRGAEVIQIHRVRRLQGRDHIGFATEPLGGHFGLARRHALRFHKLDSGLARQHLVCGLPHLAHAAFADRRHEPVAAEVGGTLRSDGGAVQAAADHERENRQQKIDARPHREGVPRQRCELEPRDVQEIGGWPHGSLGQSDEQRPDRPVRNGRADHEDPRPQRGNAEHRRMHLL